MKTGGGFVQNEQGVVGGGKLSTFFAARFRGFDRIILGR